MKPKNRRMPWIALWCFLWAVCAVFVVIDDLFGILGDRAKAVEIPDLCGSVLESTEIPEWMELTVSYTYDGGTEIGRVISQSPAAGTRRKLSEKSPRCHVSVTVSMGRERITLPSMEGLDAREAAAWLREHGLVAERVYVRSDAKRGTVLKTAPDASATLHRGDTVRLTVSEGTPTATVTVPDVRGLSRSDAAMELWRCGLVTDSVLEVDSELPTGTVVRQSHQPDTAVAKGTRLTLYVSHGSGA